MANFKEHHTSDISTMGSSSETCQTLLSPSVNLRLIITIIYTNNWRRQWQSTPVLLPGKSHGWRSLVGCSPWGREESGTTERLHFHALEKKMATHSSVLAWRIPGMGSNRVGHDYSDLAAAAARVRHN